MVQFAQVSHEAQRLLVRFVCRGCREPRVRGAVHDRGVALDGIVSAALNGIVRIHRCQYVRFGVLHDLLLSVLQISALATSDLGVVLAELVCPQSGGQISNGAPPAWSDRSKTRQLRSETP